MRIENVTVWCEFAQMGVARLCVDKNISKE